MPTQVPDEPASTAVALAVLGILVTLAVLLSRSVGRRGVPVVLLFMLLGMLAGSEGVGGIAFDDYELAFRIGAVALVLILFDGGLNTSFSAVKPVLAPACVLATAGVVFTAALVGVVGKLLGLTWTEALLLGAVVSSTDAAAVFSVLRGSGFHLRGRLAATLELESGLNDPMAVIMTIGLTSALASGEPFSVISVLGGLAQLLVGAALGAVMGLACRWVLRLPLLAGGLYPSLTMAAAFIAFALPTLTYGSGFLAVYVAGLVLGNGPLPLRAVILRTHDFVAWLAQILMFLALGLLAFPSQLIEVAQPGLVVAAALALAARPASVLLCLLPFRYSFREMAYIGWVGLRGAVPIVLATFPMMAGLGVGGRILNLVFFVVVVSVLLQGWSVRRVTRWLGLQSAAPPASTAVVEIVSTFPLSSEILAFHVREDSAVRGRTMAELSFPEGAAAMLVVRGRDLVAPRGPVKLRAGDHVYVFARPEDRRRMRAIFEETRGEAAAPADDGGAGVGQSDRP